MIDPAAARRGAATMRRLLRLCLAVAVLAVPSAAPAAEEPAPDAALEMDTAVLQGLDKITARVSTFDAPIGAIARFGTLEIVPRTCHKRPPEEPPESAAFLEITEIRPGEAPVLLFRGWMFASSPALSALEHPVYDVWVLDCQNSETSEGSSSR